MTQLITIEASIARVRRLPQQIERLVADLTAGQLTTHFLDGEWSVAQNVHHLADSHMNSYIRCKLILSVDEPTLEPYDQDKWAALPDASGADLSASLMLLHALHQRWGDFWSALGDSDWARTGFHPDNGNMRLDSILHSYAEHGESHIDQISRTLIAQYLDRPASTDALFDHLTGEWSALRHFLARHEDVLLTPIDGGWSAADHIAHITAWENFLLRHHLRGEAPAVAAELPEAEYADYDIDQINATWRSRSQAKPLAVVVAEAEETHEAVLAALHEIPFAALLEQRYPDDGDERLLLDWVIGNTYEHYQEHSLYLRIHLPIE